MVRYHRVLFRMSRKHRLLMTVTALLPGVMWSGLASAAAGETWTAPAGPPATALPRELVSALKSNGITPTPAGLVVGLRNPSLSAQVAALTALGRIGKYEQLSHVMAIAGAKPKNPAGNEVRRTAILAAVQIARRTGGLSAYTRTRLLTSAFEILAVAKTPLGRLQAAGILGELGDASQYNIVLDSLRAKDLVSRALPVVQLYARLPAEAYGGKPVNWAPAVGEVLLNKSSSVSDRTNAVIALAEIGDQEAVAALRKALPMETDQGIRDLIGYSIRYAEAKARRSAPVGRPATKGG